MPGIPSRQASRKAKGPCIHLPDRKPRRHNSGRLNPRYMFDLQEVRPPRRSTRRSLRQFHHRSQVRHIQKGNRCPQPRHNRYRAHPHKSRLEARLPHCRRPTHLPCSLECHLGTRQRHGWLAPRCSRTQEFHRYCRHNRCRGCRRVLAEERLLRRNLTSMS